MGTYYRENGEKVRRCVDVLRTGDRDTTWQEDGKVCGGVGAGSTSVQERETPAGREQWQQR